MDSDDVRALALALPDVIEAPHFDKASFRAGPKGRIFATLPPDGEHVHILVDDVTARAFAESEPTCELLHWGKQTVGVRVALNPADPELVQDLLEEAHRQKAKRR